MSHGNNDLPARVKVHEDDGCCDVTKSLGVQKMPEGYALMKDPEGMYFYWLKFDGMQSVISWNKWDAYRGAKDDAKKFNNKQKDNINDI